MMDRISDISNFVEFSRSHFAPSVRAIYKKSSQMAFKFWYTCMLGMDRMLLAYVESKKWGGHLVLLKNNVFKFEKNCLFCTYWM